MAKKLWTLEEDEIMIKHYPTSSIAELQVLLPDRNKCQIYNRSIVLKLKKDPEYLSKMDREPLLKAGQKHRFQKGNISHNKGVKGLKPWHSVATFFPKGNKPHNHRPVGSERLSKEGYVEIKVSEPKKWISKHRHVWEAYHKKNVPKGSIVIFKDGNHRNFEIENLECITRKENRLRNSGPLNLTDNFVAMCICGKKDKEHKGIIVQDKDILELKRQQLKLQRSLKQKKL